MKNRQCGRLTSAALSASLMALAVAAALPARAEDGPAPGRKDRVGELLETLKAKGVIDEKDYEALTENSAEARAARRRDALKKAQEEEAANVRKSQYAGRWNNGIIFETPDRANSVSLSGRVHADYRYFEKDTAASTFDLRRVYLTVAGKWNEWLTWDVSADLAQTTTASSATTGTQTANLGTGAVSSTTVSPQSNGGSVLDVAWFNVAFSDAAQLRFGQFKMPMSLEELTSSRFLDFQERSLVNRFVPAKERGVMLHGIPMPGLTYGIALSNGSGKNGVESSANFDRPDVIGRVSANVAEFIGAQTNAVYHVGAAYSQGTLSNTTSLSVGSEPRTGATFFSTSAFDGTGVDRQRMGLEAALAYGPFKLQGEYLNTNYSGRSKGGAAYDRDIETYYASALWMVTGERYAESYRNGTFGRISPYSNFVPGGTGTGALELGVRWSGLNAGDFATTNAAGTGVLSSATSRTSSADTLTLQAKWIWTPNVRFLINFVTTKYGNPIAFTGFTTDREKAITMRASFDF